MLGCDPRNVRCLADRGTLPGRKVPAGLDVRPVGRQRLHRDKKISIKSQQDEPARVAVGERNRSARREYAGRHAVAKARLVAARDEAADRRAVENCKGSDSLAAGGRGAYTGAGRDS
jgi:hypothetical protein